MYQIIKTPKGGISVYTAGGSLACSVVMAFEDRPNGEIAITECHHLPVCIRPENVAEYVQIVKRRIL